MPPSKGTGKAEAKRRKEPPPPPPELSFFEGFLNFVGLL
jgi:hypothetical protein